ncbi:MAG: 50S ribosomal protein L3 [Candidatus Vogelbacteria bacterium RIFOXYD1_FULL_44_32]|uniref:Large ribosomal subunit protein uL3 n=1 Tax=Candidatus Vogelbacteria bacterium RIFOXYD1_FULL_44_32 TaxID=1802438 RepID=A0A1G2QE17_9BACT|nr:MAG: 50S ribosomal protein L3 [Candidatus Vogelbacteria bacterium RIFOXYD1_FULL_44_32]
MKFLLGKKEQMTQIFTDDGRVIAGTIIAVGPLTVTQVRTNDQDGYEAVQFGFGERKIARLSKSVQGHIKATKPSEGMGFELIREYRVEAGLGEVKVGDTLDTSVFTEGDDVTVSGVSKGKGFQGVVKRHGFHGGPRSHGQKHSEREPGSIGAGGMQRVFKGKRMAGRMGSDLVTQKTIKIVKIDKDSNKLFVSGSIPGRRGTVVEIRG